MKKQIHIILISISSITNLFSNNLESDINNSHNIIHLIGENHQDPECIKIKNQLKDEARDQKIIFALEGEAFGQKNEFNTFGIEEQNTHTLLNAYMYYQQFVTYKIIRDLTPSTRTHYIGAIEVFNQYFSVPSKKLEDMFVLLGSLNKNLLVLYEKNPELMGKFFELFKLQSSPEAYKRKITKLTKYHSFEKPFFLNIHPDISLWIKFFKDIMILCTEESLRQNEHISPSTINKITSYITKIQKHINKNAKEINKIYPLVLSAIMDFTELHLNISLNDRNQIFLKNIISIFEDNKSQEKPFYAIIGAMHAPFLYEELVKKGYEVKMNSWAQEHYDKHLLESASSTKSEL